MKLILGCGYLGQRVASLWRATSERVCAVTRSSERAKDFERTGIEPIIADVTNRAALIGKLPEAEAVLYAIGHDRGASRSMREVYVEGLKNTLDALPKNTGKFIYVSSTGVYGNFGGEWIDETAPCNPDREGGRVCLAAEQLLAAHPVGKRAIILRMAGIYGPGRIPRRKELDSGEPIAAPEHGWLNLIHVDDAARVVLAAEQQAASPSAESPRLYLVSDGQPVQRGEYFRELARLLSAPPPRFIPPVENTPAFERAASDKRIRNAKMLAELRVALEYPTYRVGLATILAAERRGNQD